ncbi:MAG: hypothetical protein K2O97_14315, partial [Acetatifactor sp.]|nr:hypothetical protein [Acetatifactor sp.]
DREYFKSALANFTHEAASGGAIRHLTDLGYSVDQITKQLTFPTPRERVRKQVWERLLDTGIVLLEEPGNGRQREKAVYVEERDRCGRTSFRRASAGGVQKPEPVLWRESLFIEKEGASQGKGRRLAVFLAEKCAENGEDRSYCSCSFGQQSRKQPAEFAAAMEMLNGRQREYIQGLPWEKDVCYHRLDTRMREIVVRLYEQERYSGVFYFLNTEEKVRIGLTLQ